MADDETRKPARRTPRRRPGERAVAAGSATEQRAEPTDEGGNDGDTAVMQRAQPSPEREVPPELEQTATSEDEQAELDQAEDAAVRPGAGSAASAARRAVQYVAGLTRRDPEGVVSIARHDGGWEIGVEVVEAHRIPDSTDILAVYVVRLGSDGELVSYQRVRRYGRGQLDRQCQ